jgi:hypothetical protein
MAGTGRGGRDELTRADESVRQRGGAQRSRFAAALVLAILSGLLGPLSVVASWAWVQVSDTDQFVANYASLGNTPQLQELVTSKVSAAIDQRLGTIGEFPLARRFVNRAVSAVVTSEAFASMWTTSLRVAHDRLRAILAGEPRPLEINDGALQLQLGPFADAAKTRLVEAGVPLADRLPSIDAAVTIVQLDPQVVAKARTAYQYLGSAAAWLPWSALIAGIASVLLWPIKRRALIVNGSALIAGTATFFFGWLLLADQLPDRVPDEFQPLLPVILNASVTPLQSALLGLVTTGAVMLFLGLMAAKRPCS